MTKSEAAQIISNEYASWAYCSVADDKYFYEYAICEEDLSEALEVFDGKLPENLQLTVVVKIGETTGTY